MNSGTNDFMQRELGSGEDCVEGKKFPWRYVGQDWGELIAPKAHVEATFSPGGVLVDGTLYNMHHQLVDKRDVLVVRKKQYETVE